MENNNKKVIKSIDFDEHNLRYRFEYWPKGYRNRENTPVIRYQQLQETPDSPIEHVFQISFRGLHGFSKDFEARKKYEDFDSAFNRELIRGLPEDMRYAAWSEDNDLENAANFKYNNCLTTYKIIKNPKDPKDFYIDISINDARRPADHILDKEERYDLGEGNYLQLGLLDDQLRTEYFVSNDVFMDLLEHLLQKTPDNKFLNKCLTQMKTLSAKDRDIKNREALSVYEFETKVNFDDILKRKSSIKIDYFNNDDYKKYNVPTERFLISDHMFSDDIAKYWYGPSGQHEFVGNLVGNVFILRTTKDGKESFFPAISINDKNGVYHIWDGKERDFKVPGKYIKLEDLNDYQKNQVEKFAKIFAATLETYKEKYPENKTFSDCLDYINKEYLNSHTKQNDGMEL